MRCSPASKWIYPVETHKLQAQGERSRLERGDRCRDQVACSGSKLVCGRTWTREGRKVRVESSGSEICLPCLNNLSFSGLFYKMGCIVSYGFCNQPPQTQGWKTAHIYYLIVLDINSLKMSLRGLNQVLGRSVFLLEGLGENLFFAFYSF